MLLEKINDISQLAKAVFTIEGESVLALRERVNIDFERAIEILYNCKGRVIVTGMGKSGHIGRKIAATLSSTGTPSLFLHPAESTHGDSGIITKEDVVIGISNSGETLELLNLLPLIKRFNVSLIALTGKLNSTLAKTADVTLDISVEKEACPLGKAPTASTTVTLAMGDALAICLLKKRGFTQEDFLLYHPSGALGRGKILYRVSDLMIKGDKIPIIRDKTKFLDTVKYISEKKQGCTILVNENNKVTGFLTDGDIRRTLLKYNNISDLNNLSSYDVMTINPKTIKEDQIAAKALAIMEQYSITSIAVVNDNNEPIGLVHVHDLLKAQVV